VPSLTLNCTILVQSRICAYVSMDSSSNPVDSFDLPTRPNLR